MTSVDYAERARDARINRRVGGSIFAALIALGFWVPVFFVLAKTLGTIWLTQYYWRFASEEPRISDPGSAIVVLGGLAAIFAAGDMYDGFRQTEFEKGITGLCGAHYDSQNVSEICDEIYTLIDARHALSEYDFYD